MRTKDQDIRKNDIVEWYDLITGRIEQGKVDYTSDRMAHITITSSYGSAVIHVNKVKLIDRKD